MEQNTIDTLREALKHSPNNVQIRMLLAQTLKDLNRLAEAEEEYNTLLSYTKDDKAKLGLAEVYFKKESFSACIVILEEV
ncbi:MAG: tetratricopeptide repeat protein, partial [Bacteroidota bacterium]